MSQINHYSFNPFHNVGDIEIDLNNDNTNDLFFINRMNFDGPDIFIFGSDNCFFNIYNNDIDTLSLGDTISNNLVYENDTTFFTEFLQEGSQVMRDNLFFGFKLIISSNTYYGWMRFKSDGWNVSLKDYCINTIPNEYIVVGDSIPQAVENIVLKDINNYFDGRAILITCNNPFNEENIIEYRGFIVKNSLINTFNLDSAKNNSNYFSFYTPLTLLNNIELNEFSIDSDGDLITNLVDYNCVFLSLVDNGIDTNYVLSDFSNKVIISERLEAINSLALIDIDNNNNSSDIKLSFSPWNHNNGIGEYRLIFSDRNINDTLTIDDLINTNNYISIGLTDTTNHILVSNLIDYNNNIIGEDIAYNVYLLSIPDSTTYDIASYKMMEWAFVLDNPNLFYPTNSNYYGFQYYDIPDTTLSGNFVETFYKLDINDDNINDIEIYYYLVVSPGGYSGILKVTPLNNNEILNFNSVIVEGRYQYNNTLNWTNSQQTIYSKYSSGPFSNIIDAGLSDIKRYLPFKVNLANDTLIGYIEIIPNHSLPAVTIMGYGYYGLNPTSVKDFETNNISLYPNPVKDILNIDINSLIDTKIKIYNLNGELVLQKDCINNKQINLNEFTNGIYLVQIINKKEIINKKVIIHK